MKLSEIQKSLAALAAVLGIVVSNNLVHGTALRWTNFAIAAIGALAVYFLPGPNGSSTPPQA